MAKRRQAERKPHFFKVLLGDFTQRLKMPPNFLKHISNEASKGAVLEGPNGCSWPVELKNSCDGTFLSTGWSKFVEDHSLKEREFLVFRYNGNMHFTIQVFDTTACEREDLFAVQPCKKPNVGSGNKRGRPKKHCINSPKPGLLTAVKHEAEQLQNGSLNSVHGSSFTSLSRIGDVKIKPKDDKLPAQLVASETTIERGPFSRRRLVTTEEISRAREAAVAFSSDFPSVLVRMSISSVYYGYMMRFPRNFSRQYLPRERTNMILRDPNGKDWMVVYVPGGKDDRDRLSKGWPLFSRENNLEEGDFCVFELTSPTQISVHIFRIVEVTIPIADAPKS